MSRWFVFSAFCMLACGSGAPAKSPDDASEEAASKDAAPAADTEAPAAEKAPEKPKEASGPASNQDVQTVLQLVIDDEALEPYLHLDKPDRFPFRVGGSDLPQGLELTKATKPVVFVSDPASEKKPVLVFTEIKIDGDEASVRYRYDVEKVRGSSSLKRRDGRWVLTRSRLTEY
ncbi:MAG TPA: hypothetical protein VG937_25370 [Polyangiaceae bacterium]|nr:hypothetical protein [Polyangiaceae bacterium]